MSNAINKPTHRLVRYYGEGKNAPHAELGVVFPGENNRQTMILNTLEGQIRLIAFPIEDKAAGTGGAE